MGVIYLLGHFLGAGLITLGLYRFSADLFDGADPTLGINILGIGLLIGAASGILQAVVTQKGDGEEVKGMSEKTLLQGPIGFFLAVVFWLAPMIWAWVQFELFWDPIRFHIFASIFGACALAFWIARRVTSSKKYRGAILSVSISMVGLPLGILSVQGLSSHFLHHLSDVKLVGVSTRYNTYSEPDKNILKASPPSSHYQKKIVQDKTLEFLDALSNAELVDVEAEIEAGRMKRLEDSTLVRVGEDGSHLPVAADMDKLNQLREDAFKRDERADAQDAQRHRQAHEARIKRLREGGRIFGRR